MLVGVGRFFCRKIFHGVEQLRDNFFKDKPRNGVKLLNRPLPRRESFAARAVHRPVNRRQNFQAEFFFEQVFQYRLHFPIRDEEQNFFAASFYFVEERESFNQPRRYFASTVE